MLYQPKLSPQEQIQVGFVMSSLQLPWLALLLPLLMLWSYSITPFNPSILVMLTIFIPQLYIIPPFFSTNSHSLINFTMRTASTLPKLFIAIALLSGLVKPDPEPLQDYCIADTKASKAFFINGVPCIDPQLAQVSHFTTSALSKPGNTSANPFGFSITLTNTMNLPGFNTMGLTMARADIAANGLVPLHSHPRASEVATLLKGALLVGFIDTSNRLFTQLLRPGDSFVFPKGMIHFLYNLDSLAPAVVLAGLNSQNPGTQLTSTAAFATNPRLPDEVLKKAFQISGQDVARIRRNLGGWLCCWIQIIYDYHNCDGFEELNVWLWWFPGIEWCLLAWGGWWVHHYKIDLTTLIFVIWIIWTWRLCFFMVWRWIPSKLWWQPRGQPHGKGRV